VIDLRREQTHIFKEFDRYQRKVGESVVWFKFDVDTSEYDDVYNEGGKFYRPGILVPCLWVDEVEDMETYQDVGRRPTQRIRLAVSARTMNEVTVGAVEVHGAREQDTKPDAPWYDDRLNDIFWYSGRWYAVSNFQVKGRMRGDTTVGVSGIETMLEDDRLWDLFPGTQPPLP